MWVNIFTLIGAFVLTTGHQRVAPGVPPQQYNHNHQVPVHQHVPQHQQQQVPINQQVPQYQQQQVPQMQQVPLQQVPQHQQHVQQQQHVPMQQQQQHTGSHQGMPQGQIPVEHNMGQIPVEHNMGHQGHPQQLLNVANMMHEKEHIQEHMEVPMDTSKMTEQELQFHYFKMHDADNNNKLDGCELIKSLIHWHEQGHHDPNNPAPAGEKVFKDDELTQLIDPILGMDDGNRDGFIDYPEFVQAQQKAAATGAPPS